MEDNRIRWSGEAFRVTRGMLEGNRTYNRRPTMSIHCNNSVITQGLCEEEDMAVRAAHPIPANIRRSPNPSKYQMLTQSQQIPDAHTIQANPTRSHNPCKYQTLNQTQQIPDAHPQQIPDAHPIPANTTRSPNPSK